MNFPKGLYKFYYWILFIFSGIFYRVHTIGRENVPEGPVVICANHSSMADPIFVAVKMKNSRGYNYAKFMAKAELGRIGIIRALIGKLLIFVDRGKADLGAVKESIAHLKAGGNLVIFPEGTRVSGEGGGDAKTGVIMMALKGEAKILPVYVSEKRKMPLIFGRVDVVFGEPYTLERDRSISTSEYYHREADALLAKIYSLRDRVKK